MEQIELKVDARESLGKEVRFLRRQGIMPVHLFGHGIESMALQCDGAELRHVLAEAGKTRLINLKIGKARKPRNVVVREIQRNPRTSELLHVDFYQVRMEEEIKVDVPIVLVGEALALRSKTNMLVQELSTLAIECLPDKIPTSVEVDLSSLEESEGALHVRDLVLGGGITVLDDPDRIVAKISILPTEKLEEVVKEVVEAEEVPTPAEEESEEES
ncbi:MAG: 50S ribosomal protein L25 [Dehalococcoidia bacterium]|nr:50S ribosomal protein L25 [Dehalococcoidia bacterium]